MKKNYSQFALVSNAFPPIFVDTNTEYTIGREKKNSIVLVDDLVSRHHATIFIDPQGNAFLEDKNSRNGTLLNDQRIQKCSPLQLNDKITIGSYQINYKDINSIQEAEFSHEKIMDSTTLGLGDLGPLDGMVGNLSQIDITELFLTLEYNGKTGILTIRHGLEEGTIYFKGGNIIQAKYKELKNLPAIHTLIPLNEGTFNFVSRNLDSISTEIDLTTQQILLEYARNLDEQSK